LKARGVGIGPHEVPTLGCKNFDWVVVKLTLVLPDKGEIELRDEPYNGAPINPTTGSDGCRCQDGASHERRWHSTDGSGIVFMNDNNNGVVNGDLAGVVITADGTRYHFVNTSSGTPPPSAYVNSIGLCDWVRDRNGNKVVIQHPTSTRVEYIDQLGRMTTVEYSVSDPQAPFGPLALLVTLPGYNGQVRYYKVKTGPMNQNYRSDLNIVTPVRVGGDPGGCTVLFLLGYPGVDDRIDDISVMTQLILPDNRALTFKYNEFGEVAEVQMPTGGKVQYDYLGVPLDANNQKGLPSGNSLNAEVVAAGVGGGGNVHAVDRALMARRTYPDGSNQEGSWAYDYKIDKTRVRCTPPSGTPVLLDEWHYFLPAQRFLEGSPTIGADGTGYSKWSTGVELRSETVDGTTVLSAAEQDWSQRISIQSEGKWTTGHSFEEVANDNRIIQSRHYLDDDSFSKVETLYDQTLGDNNHVNNPIQVDEYDLDHATLKRRTTISYFTDYTGTGVNTLNILSLPHDQAVFEPTDLVNPRSLTTYEYDTYTADGNNAQLHTYTD
jgi:YD repeat-containing protein